MLSSEQKEMLQAQYPEADYTPWEYCGVVFVKAKWPDDCAVVLLGWRGSSYGWYMVDCAGYEMDRIPARLLKDYR